MKLYKVNYRNRAEYVHEMFVVAQDLIDAAITASESPGVHTLERVEYIGTAKVCSKAVPDALA